MMCGAGRRRTPAQIVSGKALFSGRRGRGPAQRRRRAFAETILIVAGELAFVGVTHGSGDLADTTAVQLRFQKAAAGAQQAHALQIFGRARAAMLLEAVIERARTD